MKNYAAGVGLVGVVISLLLVAYLTIKAYGPSSEPSAKPSASATEEGAPPADFGRNLKSSKQHVEDTFCRSECESAVRICRQAADGTEAQAACDSQHDTCVAACK